MVNRVLMWTAASPRLQRQVTENPIARRAAHRFLAGERLDEALDVAAALNSRRTGGTGGTGGTTATRIWGADAVPASGHAAESTA
jgi:proline dehydrogenase